MSEESTEKQHKPSSKRLEDLRKKGSFLRSKDLTGGVCMITTFLLIIAMSEKVLVLVKNNFVTAFKSFDPVILASNDWFSLCKELAISNFLLVMPLGLILMLVVFLATFAFGGFGFSTQLMGFKAERLSPWKNLKKIFSVQNLIELFKSSFKFILLLTILLVFMELIKYELFDLSNIRNTRAIASGFQLIKYYLFLVSLGILIIVVIDMLTNYYSFNKKAMMSFQEVKDEHKESDGNPEIKKKIRAAQHLLSQQRMQKIIPEATVIITNPTHYSVALKYTENVDNAPKIIAKGVDFMAAEIRLLAIKNAIPIYEAPALARAIYYTGKVGTYIHPELYMAVAMVLSYIFQMKNYQLGLGKKPNFVDELNIPEQFKF